jgi:vancomycin resistance protein YoaR
MYKAKIWDEDKWNIHSSSYGSSNLIANDKIDDKKYNEQKYGAKQKDISSDYIRKEEREKEEKENANIFDNLEEEKNNQEIKEDEIPFKAAKQVFAENQQNKKISQKKEVKNIEEAIKKAIDEEKKVIIIDN